ncbi:unnamed protein product [Brassicogethes aeneus]|uniref:Nose resistant-to-fluoxetine protein N-terminal domain-containing protein n=1 Tax=Brassicogethes aeneus TaxID=1431903 RepID=A0A9P0AZD1_BRAAE|nr:unnamed protein product [Brassicogethes aeneus]
MLKSWRVAFAVVAAWCVVVKGDERYEIFPPLPVQVIRSQNSVCREQSRVYVENLKNKTLWAYEMHDASANAVHGILRGSISQFGQFEQCISSKGPFLKQYCLAAVTANVPKPNPPRDPKSLDFSPYESVLSKVYDSKDPSQQPKNFVFLAWCVPASCTPTDLQNHLNNYYETVDFPMRHENVTYKASLGELSCQNELENQYYDYADISFCLIVGIIFIFVIFSTSFGCYHYTRTRKSSEISPLTKLGLAFCVRKNFQKLFTSEGSNPALNILYGMRVFCICMIIIDHRFGTHLSSGVLNFDLVEQQYRAAFGTIFFHGDLFVDSFFILSGLLVTYSLLCQFEKRFLNPGFIIFMRYIRLTPVYAFVVFYSATLFNYAAFGPMWKTIIGPEVTDCRTNWWTNLLYISNYVNAEHMCMVHSWYLPCDFHYFIVAILICSTIHRNKRIGLILLGLVTFASVLVPFLIGYIYERPAVLFFYPEFIRAPKTHPDFLLTYSKSHARSSPYFVGMIAGYIYFKMKDSTSKKKMSRMVSSLFIISSLAIMIASIVTGVIFYDPYYKYNALESALYAALHRTIWSVGSIGMLYTASFGYSGIIKRFLSWSPWIPISKLVYGAYLTHMQFQMRSLGKKGGADVVTYFDIISLGLSDIVLAFGTSLILYLTVEAPVRNIFAIMLSSPKRNNKDSKSDESVSEVTCDSHL